MYFTENQILNNNYQIKRLIATGGFSATYEAEHLMLRQRVAIKEFFPGDIAHRHQWFNNPTNPCYDIVPNAGQEEFYDQLKEKFLEEARAIFSIHRTNPIPGIVRVFDVFRANNTAYYVMDYIEGPSLGQMLKTRGRLKPMEAVDYITQVANALKAVHTHNMLHLDVKPGNIMVEESTGRAILIDFGVSKLLEGCGVQAITYNLTGKSPGFSPLEQENGRQDLFTPATDIYALGATLYKLVTGITPPAPSQRLKGEKLRALPSDTPTCIRDTIVASMTIDHNRRLQVVEDFIAVLESTPRREAAGVAEMTTAEQAAMNRRYTDTTIVNNPKDANTVVDAHSAPQTGSATFPRTKPVATHGRQVAGHPRQSNANAGKKKSAGGCFMSFLITLIIIGLVAVGIYFCHLAMQN